MVGKERDRKLYAARKMLQEKPAESKQVAEWLRSDYNKRTLTKDKALQRCNLSVVKSEVGMRIGP
jgi:hypothetical protein